MWGRLPHCPSETLRLRLSIITNIDRRGLLELIVLEFQNRTWQMHCLMSVGRFIWDSVFSSVERQNIIMEATSIMILGGRKRQKEKALQWPIAATLARPCQLQPTVTTPPRACFQWPTELHLLRVPPCIKSITVGTQLLIWEPSGNIWDSEQDISYTWNLAMPSTLTPTYNPNIEASQDRKIINWRPARTTEWVQGQLVFLARRVSKKEARCSGAHL